MVGAVQSYDHWAAVTPVAIVELVAPICQITTGPSGVPSTVGHSPEMRAVPPAATVIDVGDTDRGIGGSWAGSVVLVVVVVEVVVVDGDDVDVDVVVELVGAATVSSGAGGSSSPWSPAPAGLGPTPASISSPHAAVAAPTTSVAKPPTRITMKS